MFSNSDDVNMEDGSQHCVICLEKPTNPEKCEKCNQLIGCHDCIVKWYRGDGQENSRYCKVLILKFSLLR